MDYPSIIYDLNAIAAIQRNFNMNDITITGAMRSNSVTFLEATSVPGGTPAAGTGTMWLDNSGVLPERLKYTDSDGVEHTILSSASSIDLDDLGDVTITGVADYDTIMRQGAQWVNVRAPFESVMGNFRSIPAGTTNSVQADNSAILAGVNGTINVGCTNSSILGGDGLVVSTSDTVAMPNASINGQLYMNNNVISDVATPSGANDAANKAYVDSVATGLDIKESCRAATTLPLGAPSISGSPTYNATGGASGRGQITATLAVSNTFIIDGVLFSASNNGARILIKDQVAGAQNGIWTVAIAGTAITFNRAADFDSDAEVTSGAFTFIEEGSTQAGFGYVLVTPNPIQIGGVGGTSLSWSQFSGATYVAGNGIDITTNTVSARLKTDGGIAFETSELALNLGHTSITGQLNALTKVSNLPYVLTGTGTRRIRPAGLVSAVNGDNSAIIYGIGNGITSTGQNNVAGGNACQVQGTSTTCLSFGYNNVVSGYSYSCSTISSNAEITDCSSCNIFGGNSNEISGTNNSDIFGGYDHNLTGEYSCMVGGINGIVSTNRAIMAGGQNNAIVSGLDNGMFNALSGNITGASGCTIIGGNANAISDSNSVIVGGNSHSIVAGGTSSIIMGGNNNTLSVNNSVMIAGSYNSATVTESVYMPNLIIANRNTTTNDGGRLTLNGSNSAILADMLAAAPIAPGAGKGLVWVKNTSPTTLMFTDSTNVDHTLSGGASPFELFNTNIRQTGLAETAGGYYSALLFGDGDNTLTSTGHFNVVGGKTNTIGGTSEFCTVWGGRQNTITGTVSRKSAIVGGQQNTINVGDYSFIAGGFDCSINTGSNNSSIVASNQSSIVSSDNASIVGGNGNTITTSGDNSGIFAGSKNTITSSSYSSIVGGIGHGINTGHQSVIMGGNNNSISADDCIIAGGSSNNIPTSTNYCGIIASNNTGFYGGQTNAVILAMTSGGAQQFSNMVYAPRMIIGDGNFSSSGTVELAGVRPGLLINELTARLTDPSSGRGLLWVRDTDPSTLIYTDDSNNDRALVQSATNSVTQHVIVAGGAVASPDGSSIMYVMTTLGDTTDATGTLPAGTMDGQTLKIIMIVHAVDYVLSFTAGDYINNTGGATDTSFTFSVRGMYINLVWNSALEKWFSTGHNVTIA